MAAGISAKGSSTPIANDGWFEGPAATGPVMGGSYFSGASIGSGAFSYTED